MAVDTATYPAGLNTAIPTTSDLESEGPANFQQIKVVLKNGFPNVSGPVTPTHTVLNYMLGVTSSVQTQLDAKAPIASPIFTGDIKSSGASLTLGVLGTNTVIGVNSSNDAYMRGTTVNFQNVAGTVTFGSFSSAGALSILSGFGCNGNAPQTKYTVNAASTDLASVIALSNQLRAALVANGIAV